MTTDDVIVDSERVSSRFIDQQDEVGLGLSIRSDLVKFVTKPSITKSLLDLPKVEPLWPNMDIRKKLQEESFGG